MISAVAFALGYQARTYLTSTSAQGEWKDKSNKKRKLAPSTAASPTPGSKSTIGEAGEESTPPSSEGGTDTDSDAEDERAAATSDIGSLNASWTEEIKLVLVVNDSLKMQKGKIAAQAGHATLACALMLKDANPKLYRNWQRQG